MTEPVEHDDERLLTAYHEAGHWVAGYVLGYDARDSTVSVRPRDRGSPLLTAA